ncbi:Oidioi.mRNA.OKI2018_I69.PAR.g12531.t1.cds [Oikopleura dioica]|uniref:Oidioi.mRNA.OKI2018_I69.PAR.g12531.t1.cds n=1 Tax=Oikopleura dioica TaxID=34765 RepID=A0ABN7S7F5_OIKDI|nr:Oidioi.mRNA.OKI2018_I69.PAR.g12531.t1.cds [Oikopleura dioica]
MSDSDNEVVAEIDIGHDAQWLEQPIDPGLTHRWTIYLRGKEGGKIEKYIKSVTFKLHETFPNPHRLLESVPFQITENGYAGFLVPIEIVFRNGLTTELKYELQLRRKDKKRRKERESGRSSEKLSPLSKQFIKEQKIKEEKISPEYPPIPKISIKREPRNSSEYRASEYRADISSRKTERVKKEVKVKEEPKSDFKHTSRIANKDISELSDKTSIASSPANSMPQTPISSAHSYGRSPATDAPKHRSPASVLSHTEQQELPKVPLGASTLENLPSDDGELSDSNSSDSDSLIESSSSDESDDVDMDFIQKKFIKFAEDETEVYDEKLRKIMNIVFAHYESHYKSSDRYCENEADLQFDLTLLPKTALIAIHKVITEEIRSS